MQLMKCARVVDGIVMLGVAMFGRGVEFKFFSRLQSVFTVRIKMCLYIKIYHHEMILF